MAFFKTKIEKEIEAQMKRDEQERIFDEQIQTLKGKREEYSKLAAEAEMNGDTAVYDIAVGALIDLNENISSLSQVKASFDIINIENGIALSFSKAVNILDQMASSKHAMPDLRKIQKTNAKVRKYMSKVKLTSKALKGIMQTSNPANRVHSEEAIASVRPMIDAARSKMMGSTVPPVSAELSDLAAKIQAEKEKIV